MNILITGCNGQLGTEIRNLQAQNPQHNWFNTDVPELDITNRDAIEEFVEKHSIDGIVNCAAYTAVDKAENNEDICQLLNAEAPAYLAQSISKRNGWIIQISTDYVFDGSALKPYNEDDDTCPNSVYGKTKLVGEFNVLKLCPKSVVIRTAWLYSPYGNNFVKTMRRLGTERDELNVVADQHGTPTYAADLADAIMTIINKGIISGIYHYTNEGATTWFDFTKAIHKFSGIECKVNPITTDKYPTPAKRPSYSVLSKKKIKKTFGIIIPQWEESLKKCLEIIETN